MTRSRTYAPGVMVDLSRKIIPGELGADTGGTRLDAPFHLYADRADLAHVPLERLVNVSIVVVRAYARVEVEDLGDPGLLWGKAVLLHTGLARRFGGPADPPFVTAEAVRVLVGANVALVGIDAVVDEPAGPVRHALLGADIPVIEQMINLDLVPDTGARLTVLPPPVRGMASCPVRVVAVVAS